ncbi:hypothetical protein [Thermosulfurimonas sp. F29]|uniref:hypothetical protein n=1 Tax=Thermosulfurimonas sp. F29 TaxID=2867247 RepID=UPI001C832AD7|nr:hypothetical protein [Thermosulfurimonas sp. F29]MBX6424125.1 hypothetical protein [Thermosulfurimonas sp. F29]
MPRAIRILLGALLMGAFLLSVRGYTLDTSTVPPEALQTQKSVESNADEGALGLSDIAVWDYEASDENAAVEQNTASDTNRNGWNEDVRRFWSALSDTAVLLSDAYFVLANPAEQCRFYTRTYVLPGGLPLSLIFQGQGETAWSRVSKQLDELKRDACRFYGIFSYLITKYAAWFYGTLIVTVIALMCARVYYELYIATYGHPWRHLVRTTIVLLISTMLIMPARYTVGAVTQAIPGLGDSHRFAQAGGEGDLPTAFWFSTRMLEGGMDLAGRIAHSVFSSFADYPEQTPATVEEAYYFFTGPVIALRKFEKYYLIPQLLSEPFTAYKHGEIMAYAKQLDQRLGRAQELGMEIDPALYEVLHTVTAGLVELERERGHGLREELSFKERAKVIAYEAGGGLLGGLLGLLTGSPILGLAGITTGVATGKVKALKSMHKGTGTSAKYWLLRIYAIMNAIRYSVAGYIFVVAVVIFFWLACLVLLMYAVLYGVFGYFVAFVGPFGEIGLRRLIDFGTAIVALFISPLILLFLLVVGLIARDLYFVVLGQLVPLLNYVGKSLLTGWHGGLLFVKLLFLLFYLALTFALPFSIILTLGYYILRAHGLARQVVGSAVDLGLERIKQISLPMAR